MPAGPCLLTLAGHSEDANAIGCLNFGSSITLDGAGANSTIIDAGQLDRVMHVASGRNAVVHGLTLTNGQTPNSNPTICYGGGVGNSGTLTMQESIVRGYAIGGTVESAAMAVVFITAVS